MAEPQRIGDGVKKIMESLERAKAAQQEFLAKGHPVLKPSKNVRITGMGSLPEPDPPIAPPIPPRSVPLQSFYERPDPEPSSPAEIVGEPDYAERNLAAFRATERTPDEHVQG